MKKLFLSLVVAMMAATSTYAQSTLVATLTHGEDVSMYYGTYALREAYNAAESGDIINLSGGGFQAIDINKAITLRGTGINETVPTSIVNGFYINIPTEDTNRFSMEGIRCQDVNFNGTYDNPCFLKCQLTNLYFYDSVIRNIMFVNCRITGNNSWLSGTNTVQFVNCFVGGFRNASEDSSSASFINCIIRPWEGRETQEMRSCQLMNCILYNDSWYNAVSLPSTTIATNCVAINDNEKMSGMFNNSQTNPNCSYSTYAEIFKDFTGEYSDMQTFELTDAAKTQYLGTEGTQVGLYGGLMPYTAIPSYPRITKMNVANKTTADGKLSVEIEVSAAQ